MNLNDPRLELIHLSHTGCLSTEQHAQLEKTLCEDSPFRELYVRYVNLDLALSAVTSPSPLPVTPPTRSCSTPGRWIFSWASELLSPSVLPAKHCSPWTSWRLGLAVLAAALLAVLFPLPKVAVDPCERILQHASAEVSYWAIQFMGTPVSRDGLAFHLPGAEILFSQECSGARSTFVLLIVSIVLACSVLSRSLNRALLVLAIVPIEIVAKGLWVSTLATLTVRVGPDILDTWFHYRVDAISFVLSFISLIGLLWGIHRTECKARH